MKLHNLIRSKSLTLFDQTPDNKKPLLVNQTNKGI